MSHVVIKKNLAKALMDACMEDHTPVQKFGLGGTVGSIGGGIAGGALGTIYGGPWGGAAGAAGGSMLGGGLGRMLDGEGGGGGLLSTFGLGGLDPSNNFEGTAPSITTQNYLPQIEELRKRQTDVYNQQQGLAQLLAAQAEGRGGPSAAQAMLNQQTGQNAALQGALMASQRGASANPALLARQAAMQGAAMQQGALGQAATMRAQEQLAAQNALANQQAQMANQALQGESVQQGGLAAQNTALTTGQLGAQNITANAQAQNAATRGGLLGGIMQGAGSVLGGLFHDGGEVRKYAVGGPVDLNLGIPYYAAPQAITPVPADTAGASRAGAGIGSGLLSLGGLLGKGLLGGDGAGAGAGMASGAGDFMGGQLPATETGITSGSMMWANSGGAVPGQPMVKGDSEKNDVVPALLSPGEIVLPNSVTQTPNMEQKAIEFLRHIKGKKGGYDKVVEARKMNRGGRC